jgi:hypothetical protein
MKKCKWPQKGLQSLSPSSPLAQMIVITFGNRYELEVALDDEVYPETYYKY